MKQEFENFIFDLDGTLCDTLADIADACNHALSEFSLPTRALEEFPSFVGQGSKVLLKRALGDRVLSDEAFSEVYGVYRRYYLTHAVVKTKAYPMMPEVLSEARSSGIRLFVYTNKPADLAIEVIDACFGKDIFTAVVGIRDGERTKPCPDTFLKATSDLDIDFDKSAYFGDSITDLQTAENLHIGHKFSVTWGYTAEEKLASYEIRPTRLLRKVEEIRDIIRS